MPSAAPRLTPVSSPSSPGSTRPPRSPMISVMVAIESGSESTTTPSISKITPRRRGPDRAGRSATGVHRQAGPPVADRLPEVVEHLVVVLLERRDDLQDQRDVRGPRGVQRGEYPPRLDDARRVGLR